MRRIPVLIFLLVVTWGATAAFAGEAHFYLAPYGFASRLTGDAQVSDGATGTDMDLEDTLGVEPRDTVLGVDGFVKFLGSRISFGYNQSDLSGEQRLDTSVIFNGGIYSAGERVSTDISLTHYKLMYGYDFSIKVVTVGFLVGVHGIDIDARLKSEVSGIEEQETLRGTSPALGLTLGIHPISQLAIHAEASALSLTISGVHVKLIDGFAGVDWLFVPKFGVKAGYRYFRLDAEDDDAQDSVNLTQSGPFIGLALHV